MKISSNSGRGGRGGKTIFKGVKCEFDALHCSIVHSCSVDPQKNCRNYLITHSILKFPTLKAGSQYDARSMRRVPKRP